MLNKLMSLLLLYTGLVFYFLADALIATERESVPVVAIVQATITTFALILVVLNIKDLGI